MDLTRAVLNSLKFEQVPNDGPLTFLRKSDNIILYEYMEPIWLVQLDGIIGEFTNLMRVITEEDLDNAINERNVR